MVSSVVSSEVPQVSFCRTLMGKGLHPSNCRGIKTDGQSAHLEGGIGILKPTNQPPQEFLFGVIKKHPRDLFIGILWFDNRFRGAQNGTWVLEVYGRDNVDAMKELAEEMSENFPTNINVVLLKESPETERYWSEECSDWPADASV